MAERTRELGIRIALGCSRSRAVAGAARSGIALTFAAVGSILLTVAVLASLAPALRIVRVKPPVTLRRNRGDSTRLWIHPNYVSVSRSPDCKAGVQRRLTFRSLWDYL